MLRLTYASFASEFYYNIIDLDVFGWRVDFYFYIYIHIYLSSHLRARRLQAVQLPASSRFAIYSSFLLLSCTISPPAAHTHEPEISLHAHTHTPRVGVGLRSTVGPIS